MQPYEDYVSHFNKAVKKLSKITPTVDSVNDLLDENAELEFVKAFREIIRLKTILTSFSDFSFEPLDMEEQTFEDYKSKYLDIYDKVKTDAGAKNKASILDDVDFELELIHRDDINVAYILQLLAKLKGATPGEKAQQRKAIIDLLNGEVQLRSKKELIEKFIDQNLPVISKVKDIPEAFGKYVEEEKQIAFKTICAEEKLQPDKLNDALTNYLFTERTPMPDEIINLLQVKPTLLNRKGIIQRITDKIKEFVQTYINGINPPEYIEEEKAISFISDYPLNDELSKAAEE